MTLQGSFLCRNMTGLWLLQQARAAWAAAGMPLSYEELVRLAQQAPPDGALIDPLAAALLAPADMPQAIRDCCARTRQRPPADPAEITRCILDSLALGYRQTLEELTQALGRDVHTIHVVGGGCRNAVLCQATANATGRTVIAGPTEATVYGNLLVQASALGALTSPAQLRQVVRQSTTLETYLPRDTGYWNERYGRYRQLYLEDYSVL